MKSIYAHKQSAAAQPGPVEVQGAEAILSPASPVRRSSRSSRSPIRRSAAATDTGESLHEASISQTADLEAKAAAESLEIMPTEEDVQPLPPSLAEQALADIPEEASESIEDLAGSSKPSKPGSKASGKPQIAERRSSTRASRHSIGNLAEIAPMSGSSANMPSAGDAPEKAASPQSAAMELDSSRDSQPSTSAPKKAARATRRSSVPREPIKRKRGTTPLEFRGPSPAVSDKARNKRIKTEEPDSSVGTPAAEQERTPSGAEAAARRFRNSAPHLVGQMVNNIRSNFFKEPVKRGEALNYYDIVKRPMDFKTLGQGIRSGRVTSTADFKRDVALFVGRSSVAQTTLKMPCFRIFANAVMYNGVNHDVGRDAAAMWLDVQK